MSRQLYLAAYDITQPSRLRRCLATLKDYAGGGQKSVFECFLSPQEKQELLARMTALIDPDTDRFVIAPLDERGLYYSLGKAEPPQDGPLYYVG